MIELREHLKVLAEKHNLVGVKGGTEVEAMTFKEIKLMREISRGIVPMTVKIGGPEARNDIEYMLNIGIDKILAPMIESSYSLKNFVDACHSLVKIGKAALAINIETITAYNALNAIFKSPFFRHIEQVTVGRSDLSASMEKNVDDAEVTAATKNIVDLAKLLGKQTSTGGKINPCNALSIQKKIGSDFINTRHMVVKCGSKTISDDVESALGWEKKFYDFLITVFPERIDFYKNLISSIESRIEVAAKVLI